MEYHSFLFITNMLIILEEQDSFRLLMELYSFLQAKYKLLYPQNRTVGFRLLTELYSFLQLQKVSDTKQLPEFPSPYGVIFILTYI